MKDKINQLRNLTGCSFNTCKEALEYIKSHKNCTAIGYCRAMGFAVTTKCSFEDRVKQFSRPEDEI